VLLKCSLFRDPVINHFRTKVKLFQETSTLFCNLLDQQLRRLARFQPVRKVTDGCVTPYDVTGDFAVRGVQHRELFWRTVMFYIVLLTVSEKVSCGLKKLREAKNK